MTIFERIEDIALPGPGRPVHLAVGTFDGVHLAHAALMGRLAGEAHATGGQALIFTFRNHPRSVVAPDQCPPLLSPWPFKKRLLQRLPLDVVVAVEFTAEFAQTPAEAFVRDILVGKCQARTIHSGWNFRFGRGGYGGPGLLEELSGDLGYRYERITPIKIGGKRVSSTRIREALAAGEVAEARELLGRPHQIEAPVVRGDALGRTIGFPTANLAVGEDWLLPADGVYAVMVFLEAEETPRPGMMNIGWRPTVSGRDHRVEVHLIGFEGELVESVLAVQFIARLRDEMKFSGPEELKCQLERDCGAAVSALSGAETVRL